MSEQGNTTANGDPLMMMLRVLQDKELSPEDREYMRVKLDTRFRWRRKIALWCLLGLVIQAVTVVAGAILDCTTDTSVLKNLKEGAWLLTVINTPLTSIILSYYAATSLRPSS